MTTENFAVEHAWQKDVVGKLGLARTLCAGIHFAKGFADDFRRLAIV